MFLAFYFSFNLFLMTLALALFFSLLVIVVARKYIKRNYPPVPKTLWIFYLLFYISIALVYSILNANIYMGTPEFIYFVGGLIISETVLLRYLYFKKMDQYDFLLYRLITTGTPILIFIGASFIYFMYATLTRGY
ncbi:MAG: hypothetical protein JXL85_10005 [Bacilli bacterium]|nr:hypothetical protein [Bacilli bacterium]